MILPTQEIRDSANLCQSYIPDISLNLIGQCKTLYLWGISLTDYDVEIHYFIFNSLMSNSNIKEIYVINPEDKVVDKVKNLIKIYGIKENKINVIGINPNNDYCIIPYSEYKE